MNPAICNLSRNQRRSLLMAEAKRRKSGDWGEWERLEFPPGSVGPSGWVADFKTAYRNKVFAVLHRHDASGAIHLAVSSLSEIRPSWPEMQRIKDEIAGVDATGVEVYPPSTEVVDDANMYHLWIVPGPLPFSLAKRED